MLKINFNDMKNIIYYVHLRFKNILTLEFIRVAQLIMDKKYLQTGSESQLKAKPFVCPNLIVRLTFSRKGSI